LVANRTNYYRSFDPFEDVNEPYTRAGGPTTPVAYYTGANRGGYPTATNASPAGVFDLVGNVWDWVFDYYDPAGYDVGEEPRVDPAGVELSEYRAVRGGAWNTRSEDLYLYNRGRFEPGRTSFSIGFRAVRTIPDP
jgi:formylglycine-generating enzyme required for sulfatase activity